MLLLGHIGITAFVSSLIYLPILGGVIGVLLPDIIDKGLVVIGYAPCGRFIAHSIFFFPIAGLVAYMATKNKKFALAVALGAFLHLIQDMHDDIPFLYPLKNYEFFNSCGQIKIVFSSFVIVTEVIGGMTLILMSLFNSQLGKLRKFIWATFFKIVK